MKPKDKDFDQLQTEWYQKLKDSGFNDIEEGEDWLKNWSSHYFNNFSLQTFQAKEAYYQIAGQFLHAYEFATPIDKAAWELHATGHAIREIATILKDRGFRTSQTAVNLILKRLTKEMFEWNRKEL